MTIPAFLSREAVERAANGALVGFVTKYPTAPLAAIEAESTPFDVARISRANGREEVRFASGGSVQFRRDSTWLRGSTYDFILVDLATVSDLANIRPALNRHNDDASVVGYY